MSIFDEIGKKVSQVGAETVKMTKELSETAKLNSAINAAENTINTVYANIGKLYYEKNIENPDEMYAEMFASIEAQKQIIQRNKDQLRIIKNVNVCENCNAEVAMGVAFCPNCGSKIKRFVPAGMKVCTACGELMELDSKFCIKCGAKNDEVTGEAVEVAASVEEAATTEDENKNVCKACDEVLEEGAGFCSGCGAKVE